MTCSQLKLTLNTLGRLLTQGDVRELAAYFECPLPVYFENRFVLLHSLDKMAEAIAVYATEISRSNIRRIEPVLLRVEDSTLNRSLFVVRWNYLRADGTLRSSNVVRYVGRRGDLHGRLRIELVEYLEIGVSGFPEQLMGVVYA